MILSNRGRLLWYSPQAAVVHDLNFAHYRGEPVLGYYVRAKGDRPDYHAIIDRHYQIVRRVFPGNGYKANAHEFQLTRSGTAFIGMYVPVRAPGRGPALTDYVVQEVDVETRDVLFEWHALDHIPVSATYTRRPESGWPWDYFHGNSIEPPIGNDRTIVLSARKTSAVYGIDRLTGGVRWILGGKQDQFGVVRRHPEWQFCGQHDVRRLANGDLSVFDNGGEALGDGCPDHPARVLRFRLDTTAKNARLVREIGSRRSSDDGAGYRPQAVGSARWLSNGDVLVNWGNSGRVTQVSPRGRIRFKLQLAHWTYRATRADWHGRPLGRPAIAARRRRGSSIDVWASWNGATHVRRWRVLAGNEPDALEPVGPSFRFADLETRMRVRASAALLAVQALDRTGSVVGESVALTPRGS